MADIQRYVDSVYGNKTSLPGGVKVSGTYDPILLKRSPVFLLKGTSLACYCRFKKPKTVIAIFKLSTGALMNTYTFLDWRPSRIMPNITWPNSAGVTALCDVLHGQGSNGCGYTVGFTAATGVFWEMWQC